MNFLSIKYGQHNVPNWEWYFTAKQPRGYTLWTVWNGKGTLKLGEKIYNIGAGDLFFIDYSCDVHGTQQSVLDVKFVDFYTDKKPLFEEHKLCKNGFFIKELLYRIQNYQV